MTFPESEREMVWQAIQALSSREVQVAIEVPLLNRSIDLVFRDEEGVLTAVEFKRHDWRRALKQAQDHRLGTERVYVCVPESVISESLVREAANIGVGILAWSRTNPLRQFLDPEPSTLPLAAVSDWLLRAFRTRIEEGGRL